MKPGWVRIIGGKWRSRRLEVLPSLNVRPTPDRVRETIFNWLRDYLPGANCLDMYAGTGVLGFEALSHGAQLVDFVDHDHAVITQLEAQKKIFATDNAHIYQAELPHGLQQREPYDIVFIDPPYQKNLTLSSCQQLESGNFLNNPAYIYLEAAHRIQDNDLPNHWQLIKAQQAGHVYYHLAKRELK